LRFPGAGAALLGQSATETAYQEADAQMRIVGGEIECKIHTTAAGYSDEQTHHWLIGGSGAIYENNVSLAVLNGCDTGLSSNCHTA
jgi:hypothetical protein